jgi:putative addiction module component (TIGR02574 family)
MECDIPQGVHPSGFRLFLSAPPRWMFAMSSLMTSLGVDRLPSEEQLRLVAEILDRLADRTESPLTEAHRQELDHRLQTLKGGTTTVSVWTQVEARVLRRL